ncbi:MAG: NfeD family protein [Burkholderiales bacterium]
MQEAWIWWIAAAVLVGAELLTGTFYLLAVGLAAAIGGAVALAGVPTSVQLTVSGIAGVLLVVAAHRWRLKRALPPPQPPLDVGQTVQVRHWNADGTARVTHRGSQWTAELATPDTPRADTMVIVAMKGSVLVLGERRG